MIDISGVSYLLPIFSFVLVFFVVFAILKKTGLLGENNFTMSVVALVLALIFISFSDVRSYIELVSPWFIVLVVLMFFVLFLGGFMLAKDITKITKPAFAWVFIGLLALAFILIGYSHFGLAYNHDFINLRHWIFKREVSGSIILGIVALVAVFIVARKVKK